MFEDVDEGHLENDDTLYFHYSREERLKKAPQIVKDYYDGKIKPVKGFRALFYKQNKFIFISLILFVGFFYMHNGLNKIRNSTSINEVLFEISAFSYDEEIFSTLTVKTKKDKIIDKPQNITALVNFINSDKVVAYKEEYSLVYEKGEEYFRTKIQDYDIIRVDVIVKIDDVEKELFTEIKR